TEILHSFVPRKNRKEAVGYFNRLINSKDLNKHLIVFKYVNKVLERLKEKKIKIGVATGNNRENMNYILSKNNMESKIDFSVSDEDVKKGKPDPEMLLKILKSAKINPDEVLYVGDAFFDIETAKNAGVKSCAVLTGVLNKKEAEESKPDFIFDDIRGVLKLV
ncbi:MAG: HAD-IIIA family hydrolase, partial [Candidatus Aenigmarchaeota archaeon]|nr:HAD-IIIA family hydrolase [Candidatus Aenigmarchaeota archaeon]